MSTPPTTVFATTVRTRSSKAAFTGALPGEHAVAHGRDDAIGTDDLAIREAKLYRDSWLLLGGTKLFRHPVSSKSEVHAAIVRGLPYAALLYFVTGFKSLAEDDVVSVLGISTRTLRRQKEMPTKPMPANLGSKTWLFAETFAKASEIMGSKEEAERWMSRPAMGLDGQRPIDLLQTVQGAELVNDFLGRLEYGVYT